MHANRSKQPGQDIQTSIQDPGSQPGPLAIQRFSAPQSMQQFLSVSRFRQEFEAFPMAAESNPPSGWTSCRYVSCE